MSAQWVMVVARGMDGVGSRGPEDPRGESHPPPNGFFKVSWYSARIVIQHAVENPHPVQGAVLE